MALVNNGLRTKRKNVCDDIIFEVDLDDCSPEHSEEIGTSSQKSLSANSGEYSQETDVTSLTSQSQNTEDGEVEILEPESVGIDKELVEIGEAENEVDYKPCCTTLESCKPNKECLEVTETTTKQETVAVVANDDRKQQQVCVSLSECVDGKIPQNEQDEGEVMDESDIPANDSIITISFKDAEVAKEYKPFFVRFLRAHVKLNVVETGEDSLSLKITRNRDASANQWLVLDETFDEVAKYERSRSKKRKRFDKKKEKDLFTLDTNPSITTKNVSTRYMSKFAVIEREEDKTERQEAVKVFATTTCFNCDGNHALKDCSEPKNYAKINAARNSFKNSQTKSARYHLEEDQMYGHLTPGKISEELRNALGLRKHDLPPYIYRMRVLGYPPGWIKEAELETSDLCMFDIDGKTVSNHKRKKISIDPEKIVDYPGFNVPMEKEFHDDYRFYGVPPFSEGHDKQMMIDFIKKMKQKEEDDLEVCDMEVDKSMEEAVTENSENDVSQDSQDERQQSCRASPSLNDLESKKQQLLAELDVNTTSDSSKSCDPDAKESNLTVKTSSFGTPILKSASPYSRLPKPDNFSQNISPVINFENLPNSTGKYEQMTGILQKVRTALKGLQDETKT